MTLYGKKHSINVRKVLWLLSIIDCEYKYVDNIFMPEIKKMNPNGLVPILTDEDFTLWESNSILRYISNKLNLTNYYPVDPIERASVDKWLDWQASDFNSSWVYAFQAIVRKSDNHIDTQLINESKNKWNNCISIIDTQLVSSDFIASDSFTIADIVIAVSLNRWYLSIGEKGLFFNVDRYFESLESMKGFLDTVKNGVA